MTPSQLKKGDIIRTDMRDYTILFKRTALEMMLRTNDIRMKFHPSVK